MTTRILIVEARFYDDIADELLAINRAVIGGQQETRPGNTRRRAPDELLRRLCGAPGAGEADLELALVALVGRKLHIQRHVLGDVAPPLRIAQQRLKARQHLPGHGA